MVVEMQMAFDAHVGKPDSRLSIPPRRVSVADVATRCNASFAALAHEGEHASSCTERLIPHHWAFGTSRLHGNVSAAVEHATALPPPTRRRCAWGGTAGLHSARARLVQEMANRSDLLEHLKTYMPMHLQAETYSCLIDV